MTLRSFLPSRLAARPSSHLRFIEPLEARIAPAVVVLNVDSLATDADADGIADPGDRIHYNVTVQNTGPGEVTGLTFQEILNNPALTLVANSINVSPLAFNDSYTAAGNTQLRVGTPAALAGPATTNATKVLANDTEFLGDTFVISAFQATTANNGTVSMVTSGGDAGSFSYLPAPGFTGTDTFTYTLRDDGIDGIAGNADDLTGTGSVSITVSDMVWYVDDSAAPGGTGRSNAPLQSLAPLNTGGALDATDNADDFVFVYAGSYSGGFVLETGQKLVGEPSGLTVGALSIAASGTRPTLAHNTGSTVALSTNNQIRGMNFTNSAGSGITGSAIGTLALADFDVTVTGGSALSLTTSGTVTATGADNDLTAATGIALNVANVSIGAAGVTFKSISASGAASGIVLNGTGAAGALIVTGTGASTSGTAGAIAASLGTGGTIQNTTGDAISLTGVTGGVTLRSMILGNTSADAVTANTNVNVVGDGITLVNSDNIVLENVRIGESGGHGIDGQNVTNLSLTNVSILNAGNADTDDGVNFNGESTNQIDGNFLIKNSVISASYENNVNISNTAGNLNLTIAGSTFGANHIPNGNDSVLVETLGTAQVDVVVTTNTFTSAAGDLFQFTTNGTGGGVRDTLWFKDNVLSNNHGAIATGGGGVSIFGGATGGFAFNIENNTFRDSLGGAVLIVKTNNANYLMEGYFKGNTVGASGVANSGSREGSALKMQTIGGGTLNVAVQNNTIFGYNNFGIELLAGGGASATGGNFFATITGNTVSQPGNTVGTEAISKNGLHLNAGTTPGDSFLIALNATGNNFSASGKDGIPATGVGDIDIRLRQRQATTVELPGYAGANNDNTAVANFLDANNTGTDTLLVANTVPTGGGYINAAARALPSVLPTPPAPLLFAPDESADEPPVVIEDGGATILPPVIVDDGLLSQAELDSLVGAAIERWAATGLSAAQVSRLQSVVFTLEDLPGWVLGSAGAGVVTLDVNAAGNQWLVDPTPLDDAEFVDGASGLAAGRVDALTTILHELGHQLGLDDSYASADSASLMYGWLASGERRLPAFGQAAGIEPGEHAHTGPDFLFGAMNLGTLPANKTLTIVYDATINNLANGLVPVINSQVRILGNGGINVVSDDPAAGGAADSTVTPLDTLTLGNFVWNDLNKDGDADAGEPGVAGVVLNLFADTNADGSFMPSTDTFVATTTTAGSGLYSFMNLLPGEYIVQVAPSNFNPGGALAALTLSSPGSSDPDSNTNNDDNGALLAGQGAVSAAITLAYNTEPTAGLGSDTNNTLDFGFSAPVVDLQITKTNGVTSVVPGTQTTYTIVVSNAGPDAANGVTVTDTFPAAFTGATWSTLVTGGATGAASGTGNINDLVNLPVGAAITYTVTGTINPAATGSLVNTATVSLPPGASDNNPGNNTASDSDTLTPQVDLTITKTDNRLTVPAGFASNYIIVVRNTGPSNALGATVADLLPADFIGATWTAVTTGGATATAAGAGNVSDTVNLPAGSTITYTVNGTVALAATGTISNTATVTEPSTVTETDPANNSATDDTDIVVVPDLRVTIDDGVNATTPGAALTYALAFANNGPAGAAGVTISVPLPVGTTFDAAANAGWTLAGSTLRFTIGDLASAANGNATLRLQVKDPVPVGLFTLTTTTTIADDGTNGADATPTDNTDTDLDALPLLQLANGGKSALYLDVDGDLVTVKTTKGAFELGDFTIRAAGLGIIVERLLLAGDPLFSGTTLSWTAKPQPGNRGDGMVNIGAIDATGLDLVGVTIPGDLGQIDAGSGVVKPAALGALAVQSLGRFGLNTQNAGLTPSLESTITGPLGKLTVKTDIDGAFVNVTGANGTIGSVNVGRSLVGGAANNSGGIQSAQAMGTVKIGGHLLGGAGFFSGSIHGLTTIKSVTVGGALLGDGPLSGVINGVQSLGTISVKSDVRGTNISNGAIFSLGSIKSVKIGGGLFGGAGGSGSISSGGAIGNVTIAGNLEGGFFGTTGILAATTIGAVKIGGDVTIGVGFSEAPQIVAGGVLNPASAKEALAIKSVSIGGSVRGLNLLAGYDFNFAPIHADASIGAVTVQGDWSSSNLIAGIARGGDGMFGTADDFVVNAGGDLEILASVASVSIGGVARGAAGGPLVFLAEKFGKFKTGATTFPLTADFDDLIVGTNGIRMRELNAATAPAPVLNPTIPASVLEFFNDNKTATFTDTDGDLVTIKTTKGDLSLAGVLTFGAGGNGGQLQLVDLSGLADFEGANLTITTKRSDAGGNGFVDVGAIDATGINLGKVSIAGDLGQIDAGTADEKIPAIASLTVQSLGAAGTFTQLPGGDLKSETRGALGKLVVKTDVVGASVHVGGGQNDATNDGPLGKLRSVSIGRSLIGGQDDTGVISASGTMGKVTIGGDVRGSVGDRSGSIRADGAMSDVTIGGSLVGGLGADSGSVAGQAGIGDVTIKQSLRGGDDDRAGSIVALGGNLKGVKIGGHLVGGSDDFTGSILAAAGAIGNVTIAGSLLAFADDRSGIFSDTTIGAIKIGGDVLGGNGFTAKISAEGIATPESAAKAVAIQSLDIGGVARFVRVLAGFEVNGNAANADVQIGSLKVKGDWIASSVSAGIDPTNPHFGDGDDVSILGGGDAAIASRIGAIVIGGQAAGTFAAGDSFAFTAQQLGSVKVGKSAFKLGKKAADPLENISIGITLDLAAREGL